MDSVGPPVGQFVAGHMDLSSVQFMCIFCYLHYTGGLQWGATVGAQLPNSELGSNLLIEKLYGTLSAKLFREQI